VGEIRDGSNIERLQAISAAVQSEMPAPTVVWLDQYGSRYRDMLRERRVERDLADEIAGFIIGVACHAAKTAFPADEARVELLRGLLATMFISPWPKGDYGDP
jgi:hypothetical protein